MIVVEISCAEVWRELSEFLDGALDSAMQQRVLLHLSHCAHCKAVYDGTRNTVELIGDDHIYMLPQGFGERLFEHLARAL